MAISKGRRLLALIEVPLAPWSTSSVRDLWGRCNRTTPTHMEDHCLAGCLGVPERPKSVEDYVPWRHHPCRSRLVNTSVGHGSLLILRAP
jgi:hypothetical protein